MTLAYYLKIDGIAGDSTDARHVGWFKLSSFSLGETLVTSQGVGGATVGKASFSDLSVLMNGNTALAGLLAQGATGKSINALEIEGVTTGDKGGQTVYDLTLNNVLVSSAIDNGSDGGGGAASASFAYGKIGLVTNGVSPDGSLGASQSFGWDVANNAAIDPATLAIPASGQTDPVAEPARYFLRIDGIAGDSTDFDHVGWFDLSSFSLGESNSSTIGGLGGGTGKVSFSNLSVVLNDNAALAALLARGAPGSHLAALEIEGVTGGAKIATIYDLTLNDVLVNSVNESAAGGDGSTSASFGFAKIGLVSTGQNPDGSLGDVHSFGWDVVNNVTLNPANLAAPTSVSTDPVFEPVKYFLRIDGVAGDSTDSKHAGWFDLSSFSLGETNTSSFGGLGGATVGKVSFSDLSVLLQENTALAALLAEGASGKGMKAIEIEGVAGSGQTIYDLTLNDVLVSSVNEGSAPGDTATSASFAYGRIGLVTTGQHTDGSPGDVHSFGWDRVNNTAIDPATLATPVSLATDPVSDPVKYFLRIDGVAGDSTDSKHAGWFDLSSFSLGQSSSGSSGSASGGAGAGKVSYSDLSVTLQDGTALAALLSNGAAGTTMKAIEIEGVSGGIGSGQTVYDLTLNDVLVSSVGESGSPGDATTSASFNFGKIGLVTTGQNPGGSPGDVHSFGWDVVNNVSLNPANLATPTSATTDQVYNPVKYFLKIGGVAGDSTDAQHPGWFDLASFSLGESNSGTVLSGGVGVGVASFTDLSVLLEGNTALAALFADGALGSKIGALEIEGVTVGNKGNLTVYDLTLNDVMVSSIADSGATDGGLAAAATFTYGKIGLVTTGQNPDLSPGDVHSFGWNVADHIALDPATLSTPSSAATDPAPDPVRYFLKIDGVDGNSTDAKHAGWFEISAFSLDETVTPSLGGATGGAGVSKVSFSDLKLDVASDAALTALLAKSASGTNIVAIEIEGVVAGSKAPQTVYNLTLNDVLVSSVSEGASDGGDSVTSAAFSFGKIGLVTTGINPDLSLGDVQSFGWDVVHNVSIDPADLIVPDSDSIAPSVAIGSQVLDQDTGAFPSDLVTSNGHVTLAGTASDNRVLASVHIFDGATDLGAASIVGTNWSFAATLGEGAHALHAVATDAKGNSTATADQPQIVVDTAAPLVAIGSQVLTNDSGVSPSDRVTSDGRVTLGGTVSDNFSLAGLRIFDGATDLGAATIVGTNWTFATTLGAGSHALKAVATDTAGNSASTTEQAAIVVDMAAPLVAIGSQVLTNDTGVSPSDRVTSDGRVSLAGTVSDNLSLASLRIFDGATDLGAATIVGTNWTFATTLGAGSHALKAVATDTAGNTASTAAQAAIVVDTTAPLVAIASQVLTNDTGVSPSDRVTSDGRVTLAGTVSDNVGLASLHVFDGATDLGAATVNGTNWSFGATLAVGTHALRAVALDGAGNSASTAAQPQITVLLKDPIVGQPGQVSVSGTADADTLIIGTTNLLVNAGGGNDIIVLAPGGASGFHALNGGAGIDTLDLSALTTPANVNLASGIATGPQIGFSVLTSIENVIGGSAGDTLTANDQVNVLTGGGGADTFMFAALNAVRNGAVFNPLVRDAITDFHSTAEVGALLHDIINLQGIDAIQGGADNAFIFNPAAWDGLGSEFTAAGQLRYQYVFDSNGKEHTILAGNVNVPGQGNGLAADFQIDLAGHVLLGAGDFVL